MSFDMKPLDLTDFSGGLTDNFIEGGPTHYLYGDNYILTVDKNLQERSGTIILDPVAFNVPGNPRRVGGLFTYINDSILLAQSGRNIYYYTPQVGITSILGPSGNEPMGAGDLYSSVVSAEWNRHIYFASDAQPIPTKIYRDQNNTYQARTVGLPRANNANPNLSADQVLASTLNLANQIMNSMIAHIQDTNMHAVIDTVALNYFIAQVFNPGDELPPSGVVQRTAATDLPSLLLLIPNLNAAYEHQRNDASHNGARVYHNNAYSFSSGFTSPITPTGMHVKVTNSLVPTTLLGAAAQIDDLAQKWYWHRFAIWTHGTVSNFVFANDYSTMAQYPVTAPKTNAITTGTGNSAVVSSAPIANVNLADLLQFGGNLKFLYNTHVNDGRPNPLNGIAYSHKCADAFISAQPFACGLPDPVDYDSFANTIFWLRCLYFLHYNDAAQNFHRLVLFDTTAASSSVVNINYATPFFAGIQLLNYWLFSPGAWQNVYPASFANTFGGAGLNGFIDNAQATATQLPGQASFSQYHVAKNSSGSQVDTLLTTFAPASPSQITSQVDSVGTDAITWMAYASEMFFCLQSHQTDATTHISTKTISQVVGGTSAPYPPFIVPHVASYAYAFAFRYNYQVEPNGIQYLNIGNPVFIQPIETTTIIPPNATVLSSNPLAYPNVAYQTPKPVTITNLPVLANTQNTNYDLTSVAPAPNPIYNNLLLDIYRSTDGGVTFFLVTSVANGTTSYVDATSDSVAYTGFPALNTQPIIYTSGGVVGNDQPPQAACLTTLNGYMYYGNIIDTGQAFPNRVRQSLSNNPDAAPATFNDDLEDSIVMLSSTRSLVIALCSHSIYRLNGNFNSLGQGSITHEKISDTTGCISAKSVVRTEIGVFFAGLDGFYYTDGYQLIKITIDLNSRFQGYTQSANQQKRISGTYDKLNRRIWWTLQTNPNDTNQDVFWTYYLDYGVKPQGVFTTASNFNWFRPASAIFFQGQLIYGHELGYLFKTDNNTKTDPKINTAIAPNLWDQVYIPYNFSSCALDFGSLFMRKWTTKIHYMGNNTGNMLIQLTSIRDNRLDIAATLPVINYTYNPMWGQPNIVWQMGNAVNPYPWEYDHKVDAWRRFPAGNLRCDIKQFTITPAFAAIYRSQDWPNFCFASTSGSGTTKTVSIATPTGYTAITWPPDVVDYVIAFNTDGYVQTWTILTVGTNSMTVADPNQTLTTGLSGLQWIIRGFKKQQRVHLNSLIAYYDYLGDKNDQYLGKASAGENV